MSEMIRMESVGKSDVNGRGLVSGVSLAAGRGQWISIGGPAGSGKTALLRLVAGMDKPDSGQVFVEGQAVHRMSAHEAAEFRNRVLGVCLRSPALLPFLPAWENTALPLAIQGVPVARRKNVSMDMLRVLGIAYAAHARPAALSPYEAKLVSLARALAPGPPVLLLDEFAADLPEREATGLMELARALAAQRNLTVLSCLSGQDRFPSDHRFAMEYGRITEESR